MKHSAEPWRPKKRPLSKKPLSKSQMFTDWLMSARVKARTGLRLTVLSRAFLPLSVASTPLIQNYRHVFQILQACSRNASLRAKVVIIPCKVAVSGNKLSFWNNKGYSHRWHLKCLRTFMTKLIYISNQEFVALIISAAPGKDVSIARRSGFFSIESKTFLFGGKLLHPFIRSGLGWHLSAAVSRLPQGSRFNDISNHTLYQAS